MRYGMVLLLIIGLGILVWAMPDVFRTGGVAGPVVELPAPAVSPGSAPQPTSSRTQNHSDVSAIAAREVTAARVEPPQIPMVAHAARIHPNCLAQSSRSADSDTLAIHRWTDARGIVHFSDKAPEGAVQSHRRIEVDALPPIRVQARGYDVNLPDALSQRAVADALAIQRILHDSLGVIDEGVFALQIEFIASPKTFAERTGNPVASQAAGSYSMRDQTIRVLMQEDVEINFRILRHEITHALIHEHVGLLPTALNEGLAGFFENLRVSGMGGQVVAGREMAGNSVLPSDDDPAAALISLLAHRDQLFYGPGQESRYLQAFALIAMMMGREEGRHALASVLKAQRQSSCETADAGAILESEYPGGLSALGADWIAWMRSPPDSVHAY